MTPKKVFYGLSLSLVGVIGMIGYGLYWADGQLASKTAELAELSAQSDKLDAQITNASNLKSELKEYENIDELINEVLPNSKTQENVVGELISIALNRGLKLQGISFQGSVGANGSDPNLTQTDPVDGIPGVFSIGVGTSFQSNYQTALDFMQDIENNRRRFEIVDISISPSSESTGTPLYDVQLNLLTYIKP